MKRTEVVTTRLTPDLEGQLERFARMRGWTKSHAVAEILAVSFGVEMDGMELVVQGEGKAKLCRAFPLQVKGD